MFPDFENGMGAYDLVRVTDYSPASVAGFRAWLQRKYASVVALNAAPGRANAADRRAWQVGDRVRVRDLHVAGHVRLPAYVRGKQGVVVGVSPAYPFPDAHAHGVTAADEPTYDVRFDSRALWPDGAEAAAVHVGLFESYLEPAGAPASTD